MFGRTEFRVAGLWVSILNPEFHISRIFQYAPGNGFRSVRFYTNKHLTRLQINWNEDWVYGFYMPNSGFELLLKILISNGFNHLTHFEPFETVIGNMFGAEAVYLIKVGPLLTELSVLFTTKTGASEVTFSFRGDYTIEAAAAEIIHSVRFVMEEPCQG